MSKIRKSLQFKFQTTEVYKPKNSKEKFLTQALLKLKTEEEVGSFLRDILTTNEINEFSNRLDIARKLYEGGSYVEVAKDSKTSTTTVTRVAHWLYEGCGGYYTVLKRLLKKNK